MRCRTPRAPIAPSVATLPPQEWAMTIASPSIPASAVLSTAASRSSVVIGRSSATDGTPRASRSSRTRCQLHPSCQPPWTNTAVAGLLTWHPGPSSGSDVVDRSGRLLEHPRPLVRAEAGRDPLVGVPQNDEVGQVPVLRIVGFEHAALRAEGLDGEANLGLPVRGKELRRPWPVENGLLDERLVAYAADFEVDVGRLSYVCHIAAPL